MPGAADGHNGIQPAMQTMDWLFSPQTVWCSTTPGDFPTESPAFRALMCVFAMPMIALPLFLHKSRADVTMLTSTQVAELGLEPPPKPKRERLYHLDYFRTMAVYAVMIDHSGGKAYADWNIFASLQWTQQYLMLISGMAFMMSRSKMVPYVLRLLFITVIGMIANWLGFFFAGGMRHLPRSMCMTSRCHAMDDPDHDQYVDERDPFSLFYRDPNADPSCAPNCNPAYSFTDVNYQMGYAMMLAGVAVLCRPVKEAIQWRNDNPLEHAPKRIQYISAGYGVLFALQLLAYVYDPTESKFYSPSGYVLCLMQLFIASLVCVYPISDGHGAESHLGWILMAVMYIPRVVGDVQFKPGHWIDMFVLGLIVQKWPLSGYKKLLALFHAYAPLLFALLMMAKVQGQHGRCDLMVPHHWFERLRFNFGEIWLAVAFIVGAFNAKDPYGISRWLNWWSLCEYYEELWQQRPSLPFPSLAVACVCKCVCVSRCLSHTTCDVAVDAVLLSMNNQTDSVSIACGS
jgi:hypothetical protein